MKKFKSFETEAFFEKYEFSKPYLLSASDCESMTISELIESGEGNVEALLNINLSYPPTTGSEDLKSAIAGMYKSVSPDQIIALGAPVEGIFLAMQEILSSKDHAIVLTPAYDALINIPEAITDNVSYWKLTSSEDRWALDFNALEKMIKPQTKLLAFNFPHNPTGFLPTEEELDQILEFAKKHDLWIFSDEMYKGLELFERRELPSVADLYNKAITLRGLSKTIGLPGLRMGWLTVKNENACERLINSKYYTTLCGTKVSDYLGVLGIRAFEKIAKKNIELIESNIKVGLKHFDKLQDHFKWRVPLAGSISVVESLNESAEELCIRLAEDHGIVLLPSKYMGLNDRYFRLGLGRANFQDAINALSSLY